MIRTICILLLISSLTTSSLYSNHKCNLAYPFNSDSKANNNFLLDSIAEITSSEFMQTYTDSELGNFRVHYDTTGEDAVSNLDINQNSIPDYIDSVLYYAEDVRQFYIDRGWPEVPVDSVPGLVHGGSAAYDIYVRDIDYYGASQLLSSFLNLPDKRVPASIMRIDNNYDDPVMFETVGIEGLKITIAHEYHHAIQFLFSDKNNKLTFNLFEMTSTYFESQYVKGNTDFFRYVENTIFKDPELFSFSSSGGLDVYAWSIFFKFIEQKFGEGLLKEIWVDNPTNNFIEQTNEFLKGFDTNFPEEWINFTKWCYYTGSRSIPDFGFKGSQDWPEIEYSFSDTLYQDIIDIDHYSQNLTFSLKQFKTRNQFNRSSDTIDVIVTRVDTSRAIIGKGDEFFYNYQIAQSPFDNSLAIENSNYNFNLNSEYFVPIHFLKIGTDLKNISYAMPNPFDTQKHSTLKFPLAEKVPLYIQCELVIYNEELTPIHQKRYQAITSGEFKVMSVSFSELNLETGVYFFLTADGDGNRLFGKFTVIR